jgi:hypothetical protein
MKILIIILIMILVIFIYMFYKYYWSVPGNILEITDGKYNNELKEFEKAMSHNYPLGNDSFTISHGNNYYSFFDRLGKVYMNICIIDNKIVGTACGILRNIKYNKNSNFCLNFVELAFNNSLKENYKSQSLDCWYICDLKLLPSFRGKNVITKMMLKSIFKLWTTNKVYAISMDDDDQKENKILKYSQKSPFLNFKSAGKLMIYSVDYTTIINLLPIIKKYKGDVKFTSLLGKKDLILKSTNKPMKLLHVYVDNLQFSVENLKIEKDNYYIEPIKDYTYMFCCPSKSEMYEELTKNGITTKITATIIHKNMDDCDWNFILTSDI